MRKGWIVLLAAAMIAVFALPAMAEVNLTGFIRIKGMVSNYERFDAGTFLPGQNIAESGSTLGNPAYYTKRLLRVNTESTAHYVEERGRLRFEAKGENVGAVAFFEIDGRWGDTQYAAARNQGFALEGDTINLELKNLYIWFKPNDMLNLQAGLQGFTDAYRGIIFGLADMSGLFINGKLPMFDYRLGWAKLDAGNGAGGVGSTVAEDRDVDFYALEAHFSPMKDARVGGNFYWIRDSKYASIAPPAGFPAGVATITMDKSNIYYIGADAAFKFDPITVSGFFVYNFGTFEGATDTDIKAFAADARLDMNLGPGKFFVEGLYVTGRDEGDSDWKSFVTGSTWALAASFYTSTDMQILLPNVDDINSSQALSYEVSNQGLGMMHVGAGFAMPIGDKVKTKVGAGWLRAVGDLLGGSKEQAIEVNASAFYALSKGLDIGLVGAYAFLGDFYKEHFGLGDPDNPWKAYARLNYAF